MNKVFKVKLFNEVYSKKKGTVTKGFTMNEEFDTLEEAIAFAGNGANSININEDGKSGTIYNFNFNGVPNHQTFKILTKNKLG
jgi:hypothetical protein